MENIDLIFLFVIAAFIGYYFCKKENFDSVEEFSAINDARQAVREVYNADVDAIRNLSDVAKKLQAGGLTVPGNLHAQGVLSTGDHVNTPSLRRVGGDWLRINDGGNGRIALYGNLSINDTTGGNSGLAVGDWKHDVGQGNILATGTITARDSINGNNINGNTVNIVGGGSLSGPTANTRITNKGIIFGDTNNRREGNSAQITAGLHEADSLNIVGMSDATATHRTRKITAWAEGGFKIDGPLVTTAVPLFYTRSYNVPRWDWIYTDVPTNYKVISASKLEHSGKWENDNIYVRKVNSKWAVTGRNVRHGVERSTFPAIITWALPSVVNTNFNEN